jgi:hypothetical protein
VGGDRLQLLAKVGLLVEPVFEVAIASVPIVNKAAPAAESSSDAAESPSSSVSGSNGCGSCDKGGGDDRDSRIAKVSLLLVALSGIWLALHVLFLVAYVVFVHVRKSKDTFWNPEGVPPQRSGLAPSTSSRSWPTPIAMSAATRRARSLRQL